MRELKFRVYDNVLCCMYTPDMEPNMWRIKDTINGIVNYPDGVLMQFTGLKDKNEKDIYDGDLLKFFDKIVAVVVWQDFGGWSYNWIDETYKRIRSMNPEPFFRNISLFEVVGNIYENPELLKK